MMKRLVWVALLTAIFCVGPVAVSVGHAEKILLRASHVAELVASEAKNIRIIDCRISYAYADGHIPGAISFDVRELLRSEGAWGTAGVRRPLEEREELFGRQLGIDSETMVILYDDEGLDATRLYWELRQSGHDKVAIIFGGWYEWKEGDFPVEMKANVVEPEIYVATVREDLLATAGYIQSKLGDPNVVLLDVRSAALYKGDKKHPKAKFGGHLPGAVNISSRVNWEKETYLKDPYELAELYEESGVVPEKEIIVYCDTGFHAANTYFVLKALEYPNVRVYDYSWLEWGNKAHLPKIVGSAK